MDPSGQEPATAPESEVGGTPSAGYYVWPLVWMGAAPDGMWGDANAQRAGEVSISQLSDVVFEIQLPGDLRAKVHRDGLVVFDLSIWAPRPSAESGLGDFSDLASSALRRVGLMNAHVACLHTAVLQVQNFAHTVSALSPSRLLPMNSFDAPTGVSLPDPCLGEVYAARFASTYSARLPPAFDWRLTRRNLIVNEAAIDRSFKMLSELLALQEHERVIRLYDLLVRAASAYADHDYSQGLISAWAVIESLLQETWDVYLEQNRTREIDGKRTPFINTDRKSRLVGIDMTASLVSEMLSILDRLPFELYRQLSVVRTARNKWIHSLRPVTAEDSALSISVAQEMIKLIFSLNIDLSQGLSLTL